MKTSKIHLIAVGLMLLVFVVVVSASAASITVTSPNGGESFVKGSHPTLTWTSSGTVGSYVKMELLKGSTVAQILSSSTPNDGSFVSWTIPSWLIAGADYRIRITSTTNTAITDTSNSNFAITSAGTALSGIVTKSDQWVPHNTLVPLPTGFTQKQCDIIVSQYHFTCPQDAFLDSFTSGYMPVVGDQIRIQASGYCKNSNLQLTQITGYSNYLIICHS